MGRILTLRGVISQGRNDRIMLFDSNVTNTGWKVLDFRVQNQDYNKSQTIAILSSDDKQYGFLDWDPNTVIACCDVTPYGNINLLLDYNHVVVSSLFLSNANPTDAMNYLVVLEEIPITPEENIIYQLKEIAQTTN